MSTHNQGISTLLLNGSKDLLAGTVGGFTICLVGHPFDTMKVRLQTQPSPPNQIYSGLIDCFKKTVKWEGFGGLYKGVGSPIVGQMFFRAVLFSSYAQSKKLLEQWTGGAPMHIKWFFVSGAFTGFSTAFIEGPIDLFKSQVQVEIIKNKATGVPPKFRNVFHCASVIYKAYGVRGCFQGLQATIIRNTPASASFFGCNELTRRVLTKNKQPGEKLTNFELLAGGGVAGLVYWTSTFPLDVIKSSLQSDTADRATRKYSGWFDCFKKLYQEDGIKRFTKGFTPCIMRSIPANMAMWVAYEKTRALLG